MDYSIRILKNAEHALLKFFVLLLVIGFIFQGFVNIWLYKQQRIILDPLGEPNGGEIWISRTEASPEYLNRLTLRLLPWVTTFHPGTLEAQISRFLEYVSPDQFSSVRAELLAQAEQARVNDLSQSFFIQKVEPVGPNTIRATGIIRRFVGKTLTTEEIGSYDLSYEIRAYHPFVVGFQPVAQDGGGSANRGGK